MKKEKEIGITVTLVGKKRTLKEIANEYKFLNKTKGFILVAKWQQEQDKNKYSYEDLKEAFKSGRMVKNYKAEWEETYSDTMTSSKYEDFNQWLEQFKKK